MVFEKTVTFGSFVKLTKLTFVKFEKTVLYYLEFFLFGQKILRTEKFNKCSGFIFIILRSSLLIRDKARTAITIKKTGKKARQYHIIQLEA